MTDPQSEREQTPTDDARAAPLPMPKLTTPTWEMELLISGATVFAMLQLPALLDHVLYEYMPRFGRELSIMLLLTYVYTKAAVIALILTFILHLALRGYWVALVGMHSVHPDGIRWEKLKMGPFYGELVKRRYASMPELIERADNRATRVFGLGIGFALVMITPLAFVIGIYALAFAMCAAFGWQQHWNNVSLALMAIIFAPFGLLMVVDKTWGNRIKPDGWLARMLRGLMSGYVRFGAGRVNNVPMTLFTSQAGTARATIVIMTAMTLLFGYVFFDLMRSGGEVRTGNYAYYPQTRNGAAATVRPEHYANLRDVAAPLSVVPFIQADIVRDPYVRLFVPYEPARHNYWLAEACPAIDNAPTKTDSDQAQYDLALLACIGQLSPITLDGQTIADPQYQFYTDPQTGLLGVMSMIAVRDLERGRHELVIRRAPRAPGQKKSELSTVDYRIPFWL